MKRTTKSKTFKKGDDFSEILTWIVSEDSTIETNDYTPEGGTYSGGEPIPYDPVSELKHKYIVTISKLE
jgi:hypothetical protein